MDKRKLKKLPRGSIEQAIMAWPTDHRISNDFSDKI